MRIDIIVPSRTQPQQGAYLSRMMLSVARQRLPDPVDFRIIIGLDPGASEPESGKPGKAPEVLFAYAKTAGQAAALNAALALVDSDFVALLEDDDTWNSNFCQLALKAMAMSKAEMHTSNQVVLNQEGAFLGISDFPTPSSWLIKTEAADRVGLMDPEYKYHLDHDWLGRAKELEVRRVHVIEQSAPRSLKLMQYFRPVLARVAHSGSMIFPTQQSFPLINRYEHEHSGMMQVRKGGPAYERSNFEKGLLRKRYGNLPQWHYLKADAA